MRIQVLSLELVHRCPSLRPLSPPTRDDVVLLEHVHERVEHLEAALPHRQVVLLSQLDHIFELDLSLISSALPYEVVVPVLHGSDHHAVPQRVLECDVRRGGHGGLGLEGRDFAMELRGALLREVVQGALLHPVRLVEHAEQRGQVELPRVDATVEEGRAHYGRFWYSKSE